MTHVVFGKLLGVRVISKVCLVLQMCTAVSHR